MTEPDRALNCLSPITELRWQSKQEIRLVGADTIREPFEAFEAAVRLMMLSDLHKQWTVSDLDRLLIPPIQMGQCLFAIKDDSPIAFVSWALFSEEASLAFANRARPLRKEDWRSGDQLWIVDFIGPFGFVPEIVRMFKGHLMQRYPVHVKAFAIRYKERGRIRRLSRWPR